MRKATFGHVRQFDAVAARFLQGLAERSGLLGQAGDSGPVMMDVDDSVLPAYGYRKQDASRGYSGVKGLNMALATVSGSSFAPVIVGTRLRKGSTHSARGAARLVGDGLTVVARTGLVDREIVLRADSAFYSHKVFQVAAKHRVGVSVTAKLGRDVCRVIESIGEDQWVEIKYRNAVFVEQAGGWVSDAQVAEVPFTAFGVANKSRSVAGRLVVRRVKDLSPKAYVGQGELFTAWRYHPVFTTLDAVAYPMVKVDEQHRDHAVVEQVHADLKASAMAHVPSGVFAANSVWLVLAAMAFNLTRAVATLTGQTSLARATTVLSGANCSMFQPGCLIPVGGG